MIFILVLFNFFFSSSTQSILMTPMCYLTRVEWFSASHRLNSTQLSDQENRIVFGKCNGLNGHGHNYKLEVTVFGPVNSQTGMVMNMSDLKSNIQSVLDLVDHKNLDLDVDFFRTRGIVSTTENLSIFIWHELSQRIPHNLLHEIKLWETEKNVVVYRGELSKP